MTTEKLYRTACGLAAVFLLLMLWMVRQPVASWFLASAALAAGRWALSGPSALERDLTDLQESEESQSRLVQVRARQAGRWLYD